MEEIKKCQIHVAERARCCKNVENVDFVISALLVVSETWMSQRTGMRLPSRSG